VPGSFDHMFLGIDDLERGIAFVEERTGIRATFGAFIPDAAHRMRSSRLARIDTLKLSHPIPGKL
jgi:hypothetical protein